MDFIFEPTQEIPKHTIWDDHVPIVSNEQEGVYSVYLCDQIETPSYYNKLCYLLDTAKEGEVFYIHLNTPGGCTDSAFQLRHSLLNTKASTYATCCGTVASAGTIIALSCQELDIAFHTQFMIHNYSMGTHGKGHEIMDYVNFNDKTLKAAFNDIYSGFLTKPEIDKTLRGKDIWLNSADVKKRFDRMKAKNVKDN